MERGSQKEQGQRVLKREEIIETLSTYFSIYGLTVVEMKQSQKKQVQIRESLLVALLPMITLGVERGLINNQLLCCRNKSTRHSEDTQTKRSHVSYFIISLNYC